MNVAFDLPYYAYGARGTSQYGQNILRAMGALSPQDKFYVFTCFYRDYDKHRARLAPLASKNILVDIPHWPQRLVDFMEIRLHYPWVERHYLDSRSIDLFHTSGFRPIQRHTTVTTVHGIPWGLGGIERGFEIYQLPQVLKAARIMAPSRCALEFLLKHYPVDAKKCSVVYYGVDHDLFRPRPNDPVLAQVRKRYSLPERFLLCVGPFQFRDNIELVLYTLRQRRDHPLLRGLKIVLAGGLEEYGHTLKRRVQEWGLEDRVLFAGYVPHADLAAFYNLAEFYLHPSFYEELGAQLLEASASGCAILAARTGGVEEAAGQGAVYFNPHQLEEFEKTLFRALESTQLQGELRQGALESSRRFSWETAARQTLEIYREAVKGE
jgi:glycosyltransferase involved in cell wall biosynthesis